VWSKYVLFPMAGKDSGCDSVSWIKRLSPDTSSAESLRTELERATTRRETLFSLGKRLG
jgi:hypothetical protein